MVGAGESNRTSVQLPPREYWLLSAEIAERFQRLAKCPADAFGGLLITFADLAVNRVCFLVRARSPPRSLETES